MIKFELKIKKVDQNSSVVSFKVLEQEESIRGKNWIDGSNLFMSPTTYIKIRSTVFTAINFPEFKIINLNGAETKKDGITSTFTGSSDKVYKFFNDIIITFKEWAESLNLPFQYDLVSECFYF